MWSLLPGTEGLLGREAQNGLRYSPQAHPAPGSQVSGRVGGQLALVCMRMLLPNHTPGKQAVALPTGQDGQEEGQVGQSFADCGAGAGFSTASEVLKRRDETRNVPLLFVISDLYL